MRATGLSRCSDFVGDRDPDIPLFYILMSSGEPKLNINNKLVNKKIARWRTRTSDPLPVKQVL